MGLFTLKEKKIKLLCFKTSIPLKTDLNSMDRKHFQVDLGPDLSVFDQADKPVQVNPWAAVAGSITVI